MEGKEAIINKIISDATEKAAAISDKAEEKNAEVINEANSWAQDYIATEKEKTKAECSAIIEKRITAANMDVNKLILAGKREVIDKVFDLVVEKMCNMDKNTYLVYLTKLVENYADEGDEVILSKTAPITEEEFTELSAFKGKKLIYKGKGDFKGGIRLSNAVCDTDLSFLSIVTDSKDLYENLIAKKLFG